MLWECISTYSFPSLDKVPVKAYFLLPKVFVEIEVFYHRILQFLFYTKWSKSGYAYGGSWTSHC